MIDHVRQLTTPLGRVSFTVSVTGRNPTEDDGRFAVTVGSYAPELPHGMSVQQCHAVLLNVKPARSLDDIRFEARWLDPEVQVVGPETGEWLDAQRWETSTHIALVGTEDEEALRARLPQAIDIRGIRGGYPIEYASSYLAINIAKIPASTLASLHFVVAWNANPEEVEHSCWYAVDSPHDLVARNIGLKQLSKPE